MVECSQTTKAESTYMLQHMRKTTALITIIVSFCCTTSIAHESNLPDLGNEFRSYLSVQNEKLIGDHFMREIRAAGLLHHDPVVHEYIRYLGNRLTPYMPIPYANIQPKFFAVRDKTINAFAFFGAHVAVHSGLIALTASEDELAGVMAHELAHVSQQHLVRAMAESSRTLPLAIAGSIAAGLLAGPEMIIPVLAGHMQHMVNFTRQHEQEADRIGMQILSKAKFDPQGLPDILERMSINSRYQGKLPEYLSTHPLYESRISDTRHRASALPYVRKPDSPMYILVKARVKVQNTDNLQQYIYELQQQLSSARYENALAIKYAYAYALHKSGKNKEALTAIKELVKQHPDNLILQMTTAEIETDNAKYTDAQMRLEDQLTMHADSQSLKLQYIELLILTSQAQLATRVLNDFQQQHPTDLSFYELRRQAEGMLDNRIGVYEANAEWYYLVGNYESAMGQLEYALEQPNNTDVSKARIEQRRAEIKSLIKRLDEI